MYIAALEIVDVPILKGSKCTIHKEMDMKYIFPIQVYRIYFSKKIHSAVILKTKKNCAYIVVLCVALYMTQLVSNAAQD